jgi:hypothetical protein
MAYMIFISSRGLCGEDDLRCPRMKEVRLPAGKVGCHQMEKRRYGLDMRSFWPGDNCRIIADIDFDEDRKKSPLVEIKWPDDGYPAHR